MGLGLETRGYCWIFTLRCTNTENTLLIHLLIIKTDIIYTLTAMFIPKASGLRTVNEN